jgi:hypothetical protein
MNYRLDLGKLFGDTFEIYKRNFGTACLVGLVLLLLQMPFQVCGMVANVLAEQIEESWLCTLFVVVYFLVMICQILVQWYVILGAIRQGLYLSRGGTGFQARQMFPPFMMYLKVVGLMLFFQCVFFGLALLFILPGGIMCLIAQSTGGFDTPNVMVGVALGVLVLGALCYFVPYIWLAMRLFLAQVFIADQDTGIIDSIRYSWRISSGNFWMIFLTVIVLTACSMLGMFLCCVGCILTMMIMYIGIPLMYLQLTGQPNCLDYPPLPPQNFEVQP